MSERTEDETQGRQGLPRDLPKVSFLMLSDDSTFKSSRDHASESTTRRPASARVMRRPSDWKAPVERLLFMACIIPTCFVNVNVRRVVKVQRITITQQAEREPLEMIADSSTRSPIRTV